MSDNFNIRPEWLAKVSEPVIEPDLPICDAHHHLWAFNKNPYQIEEFLGDISRDPIDDSKHNIVSTIFVECTTSYDSVKTTQMRYVGETRYVEKLAQACARRDDVSVKIANAIIARADIDDPRTLPDAIEAHQNASPSRFRGFRHAVGWDADPVIANSHTDPKRGLLLNSNFQRGASIIAEHNLIFETVTYHTQLGEVEAFAKSVPNLKIVLDHIGGIVGIGRYAGKREIVFEEWARGIASLAKQDNVYVKLGGTNMVRSGFDWHTRDMPPSSNDLAETLGPYYQHAIQCFGPERCMFESNFPMDKISSSYNVLWNAFKKMTASLPTNSRNRLFKDTAETLYRI